ncbi:unnamed protein product [Darwinula stevensoni]|uniref:Uncharacterized protein n=1 Tax=Darwinula stevensoni TaxID=69355 RepID=A0A7R9A8K9_9CRUS|nr:unnamed protein product [Darwinula stevensoni]CAG0896437.1 unnamed protein product [Darwinula stevensoni]
MDQAKELLDYYRSNPTAQNIRIESPDSVAFPEVTVCPGVTWNSTAIESFNLTDESFGDYVFHGLVLGNVVSEGGHGGSPVFAAINASEQTTSRRNKESMVSQRSYPECPRKCQRTSYDMIREDPTSDSDSRICRIQINIPTSEVEIVEEQSLTSLAQFFSDIGGIVGFYLGFSILGVYECLEVLAVWVKYRFFATQIPPDRSYYEIRLDTQEEPFTAVKNVNSSGQTSFLARERSSLFGQSLKYSSFFPSGSKCNEDENYDYKKRGGEREVESVCLNFNKASYQSETGLLQPTLLSFEESRSFLKKRHSQRGNNRELPNPRRTFQRTLPFYEVRTLGNVWDFGSSCKLLPGAVEKPKNLLYILSIRLMRADFH